ncbi:MAG: glyoxalase [Thermoleophilaceae bacterium]|nr:glyoxalase [Thermoleophilaceae bacterium]
MLDHVGLDVADYQRSRAFYIPVLQTPGMREIYHPSYYGAFVLDHDGNNVEAVSHNPT